MEYSEVPQLIDFFKCEAPLRQERTQDYQLWSPSPYQLNGAIAEEELEPEHPSGVLVDFFKTGDGDHRCELDAALPNRYSFQASYVPEASTSHLLREWHKQVVLDLNQSVPCRSVPFYSFCCGVDTAVLNRYSSQALIVPEP